MGFHRTVDLVKGIKWCFSLWKLAFKENGILVENVDFKLSKNTVIEVN